MLPRTSVLTMGLEIHNRTDRPQPALAEIVRTATFHTAKAEGEIERRAPVPVSAAPLLRCSTPTLPQEQQRCAATEVARSSDCPSLGQSPASPHRYAWTRHRQLRLLESCTRAFNASLGMCSNERIKVISEECSNALRTVTEQCVTTIVCPERRMPVNESAPAYRERTSTYPGPFCCNPSLIPQAIDLCGTNSVSCEADLRKIVVTGSSHAEVI